jgi:Ig-like domain CHU_C associated
LYWTTSVCGQLTWYYRLRSANSCGTSISSNVIPIYYNYLPQPPISISGNTNVVLGASTSLTANGCSNIVKWYDATINGNLLFTGNPFVPSPTINTNYYVTCTSNTCESTTRTSVAITICNNLRESLKSGTWDDTTVWSCGASPTSINPVQINSGHIVSLPVNFTGNLQSLILKGQLIKGVGSKLKFGN